MGARNIIVFSLLVFIGNSVNAATPTAEEMWEIIQQQQQIIEQLQQKLDITEQKVDQTEQKVVATEQKVEETQQEMEDATEAMVEAQSTSSGTWADKTSVGGYGELHYNSVEGDDEIDFHRFVLYFGHEFTDDIRFFSEVELEHALAGEGKEGEVELEQAWIELDITDNHRFRAGLDIVPVGIVNYTHEPNTFYGVERPQVESRVIPSTWWEAGFGFNGEIAPGWNYDLVFHSGLETITSIRSGRQKVSEANADHPAGTARLRYTGIPGLEIGGSVQYQSDITADLRSGSSSATLVEGHVDWKHSSGFGFRGLYAHWDIEDILATAGDDEQHGFYLEPAYRFPISFYKGEAGVFARYSEWELSDTSDNDRFEFGMNYWPHPQVAFKVDWFDENADQGFNLGLGYEF